MSERKLLKIKFEALRNFQHTFGEAVRHYNALITNLKHAGVKVENWQQLQIMIDMSNPDKPELSEPEKIIVDFMKIAAWKRQSIKPELCEFVDNQLRVNESKYQKYIEDSFHLYEDSPPVVDKKNAAINLVEALNDALHYWPLDFMDLPICFGFKPNTGYYFREELLKL